MITLQSKVVVLRFLKIKQNMEKLIQDRCDANKTLREELEIHMTLHQKDNY